MALIFDTHCKAPPTHHYQQHRPRERTHSIPSYQRSHIHLDASTRHVVTPAATGASARSEYEHIVMRDVRPDMLFRGWHLDLRVHLQQLRLQPPRTAAEQLRDSFISTDAADSTAPAEMANTTDTKNTTDTAEIADTADTSDTTNVTAQHDLSHSAHFAA